MKIKKWAIISIFVLFLIFLVSNLIFYSNIQDDVLEIKEAGLNKNKGLTLLPGEKYNYNISEELGSIEFNVVYGFNCMEIYVFDQETGVCLKSDGTDQTGSNLTLGNPEVAFFKPWMLAIDENWEWNVSYIDKQTTTTIAGFYFKVIGAEEIYGRDAFVVEINGPGLNVTEWIDKEKRVLLLETGGNYKMEIAEAPFELEKNEANSSLQKEE